ncbi:MAG: hypothetical protein AABW54_01585 [Candidatus Micrarchaeota archaeon]
MSFVKLASNAFGAFKDNWKSVVLFSVPFLLAFPLAVLLPNYPALGGIFLRPGSLGTDVSAGGIALMLAAVAASMLLFSLAVVAINSVVKSRRTLTKLKQWDFERMETATLRMFGVYLVTFIAVFAFNLLLFQLRVAEQPRLILYALFSLAAYAAVLFAPQAIVLDNRGIEQSIVMSSRCAAGKLAETAAFVILALVLMGVNAAVFTSLQSSLPWAIFIGVLTNSLLILPFLELLKVQIYLSKYSLL